MACFLVDFDLTGLGRMTDGRKGTDLSLMYTMISMAIPRFLILYIELAHELADFFIHRCEEQALATVSLRRS
jgi:hypothetical protein